MNQSNFLENNCTFSLLKPELLKNRFKFFYQTIQVDLLSLSW